MKTDAQTPGAPPADRGTVLVVDDEPDLLDTLGWQLETIGYTVDTAGSGEGGLAALADIDADVLVADIRMPGIDGIELIQRALGIRPELQCIVLTGHGDIDTAVAAMRAGAINYLRKPVGVDELDVAILRGVEKRRLIQSVHREQARLAQANAELRALRDQLRDALARETAGRKAAEAELKTARLREAGVATLALCLRCWRQATGGSKIDFAEKSRIWTATLDNSGTYRTRTLDRYLKLSSLPPNPRYGDILDTAYFVLSDCALPGDLKSRLENQISDLEQRLRESD